MPTSTVPAVPAFRAALLPLLQDRPGLAGVQVEKVWPGPTATKRAIYLSGTDSGPRGRFSPGSLKTGRQRLNEESEVPFVLWDWRATNNPVDDPETALFELFEELVGTMQDNPQVSSTIQWASGISYETRYPPMEKGRAALMDVVVTLNARLI